MYILKCPHTCKIGVDMKKTTKCVHSGTQIDVVSRGINTPIHTSSSYGYLDVDTRVYPRYFNTPNQRAVVTKLAALEQCENGVLFSSGMAAISTVFMAFLKPGDHVVVQDDIYGGAHASVSVLLQERGIHVAFAPADADHIADAITGETKLVYIESPTNPLLKIIDIKKVGTACRSKGVISVIDNTFASPIHQNPSQCSIDIVIHSGTKYLAGHSDLCCGAVLGSKKNIETVTRTAVNLGGALDAQACYLLERSIKTLGIRMERQTENAMAIAGYLVKHPLVEAVHYPGLPNDAGHDIAKKQMSGFGAMVAFTIKPEAGTAHNFMKRLHLVAPALSLGGVETTICDPATTSHAKVAPEVRERQGVSDRLLRLSVGIEDSADIIADLEVALGG